MILNLAIDWQGRVGFVFDRKSISGKEGVCLR